MHGFKNEMPKETGAEQKLPLQESHPTVGTQLQKPWFWEDI